MDPAYLTTAVWLFGGGVLLIILIASRLTKPTTWLFLTEKDFLAFASFKLKIAGLCAIFFCISLYTAIEFGVLHFAFIPILFLTISTGFSGVVSMLIVLRECMEYLKSTSNRPQSLFLRASAWILRSTAYALFFFVGLATTLVCLIGFVFGVVPTASRSNTFVHRDSMPTYFWITFAIWALFSGVSWYFTVKFKVKPTYPWFPKNN